KMQSVSSSPLEMAAARPADEIQPRPRQLLGILGWPEIAALGLESQNIEQGQTRLEHIGRQLEKIDQAPIGELQAIVRIEQRHAPAHVVDPRRHAVARLLARRLAFLDLSDVAMHAEQAAV